MKRTVLSSSAAMAIALAATQFKNSDDTPLVQPEDVDIVGKSIQIIAVGSKTVQKFDPDLAGDLLALDDDVRNFSYQDQVVGSPEDVLQRMKTLVSGASDLAKRRRTSITTWHKHIMEVAVSSPDSDSETSVAGTGAHASTDIGQDAMAAAE